MDIYAFVPHFVGQTSYLAHAPRIGEYGFPVTRDLYLAMIPHYDAAVLPMSYEDTMWVVEGSYKTLTFLKLEYDNKRKHYPGLSGHELGLRDLPPPGFSNFTALMRMKLGSLTFWGFDNALWAPISPQVSPRAHAYELSVKLGLLEFALNEPWGEDFKAYFCASHPTWSDLE